VGGADEQVTAIDAKRQGSIHDTEVASGSTSSTLGLSHSLGALPEDALELPKPETVLRRAAYEQTRRTAATGLLFNVAGLVIGPLVGGDPIWSARSRPVGSGASRIARSAPTGSARCSGEFAWARSKRRSTSRRASPPQ
jgi:hypothetical protein